MTNICQSVILVSNSNKLGEPDGSQLPALFSRSLVDHELHLIKLELIPPLLITRQPRPLHRTLSQLRTFYESTFEMHSFYEKPDFLTILSNLLSLLGSLFSDRYLLSNRVRLREIPGNRNCQLVVRMSKRLMSRQTAKSLYYQQKKFNWKIHNIEIELPIKSKFCSHRVWMNCSPLQKRMQCRVFLCNAMTPIFSSFLITRYKLSVFFTNGVTRTMVCVCAPVVALHWIQSRV